LLQGIDLVFSPDISEAELLRKLKALFDPVTIRS
jgi:hypothetical protein